MKIRNRNQAINTNSFAKPLKKKRVVDALVIQTPNLGLYLKMQNLLNYFLDSLKEVLVPSDTFSINVRNIELCIQHIEQLFSERESEFNLETRKVINEFIEEIVQFKKLLKVFFGNKNSEPANGPADILLSAKFSRLQWLSVCILEELKYPFEKDPK